MVFLTTEDLCEKQGGRVHIITYGSVAHKRDDKNTGTAETYQLIDVVEATDVCYERASQMRTVTQYGRDLPRNYMKSVWRTDCRSCCDTMQKLGAKTANRRLGIELASLRQCLWRSSGSCRPTDVYWKIEMATSPTPSTGLRQQ